MSILQQALNTGIAPNVSDAYTINGQPGDLYQCSSTGLDSPYYVVLLLYALAEFAIQPYVYINVTT